MQNAKYLILLGLVTSCGNSTDGHLASDGRPGLNSFAFAIPESSCANGGITVVTGIDINRDFILQGDELLSAQEVCNGLNGESGSRGFSSLINVSLAGDLCPNGGALLLSGLDTDHSLVLEASEITSSNTICNGTNGQNAPIQPFAPVEVLDPCGAQSTFDEVLLRLSNGNVLASFSQNASGLNTRFTLIPDGNFGTTDNTNCSFSLSTAAGQRCMNDLRGSQCWSL